VSDNHLDPAIGVEVMMLDFRPDAITGKQRS
jgi:hypothetical protein